jgi:hypothetical protein
MQDGVDGTLLQGATLLILRSGRPEPNNLFLAEDSKAALIRKNQRADWRLESDSPSIT